MATSEERQKILQMVGDKQITADQAAALLSALGDDQTESTASPIEEAAAAQAEVPAFANLWLIPLWIGMAILILGALALSGAYQSGGAAWLLLICGWPLLLIGLLTIIAAWFSRGGPWVHIRVLHTDRRRGLNLKLSLPLNLSLGVLKLVRPFVPRFQDTAIDDLLMSLKDNVNRDQPLVIDVNEDDDGEHIQVVIG